MKQDTPQGDGNLFDAALVLSTHCRVMKQDTPQGDGNNNCHFVRRDICVMKQDTPQGNGSIMNIW